MASIAMQLIKKPKQQVDLVQAVALGIASGGFTCFYNGGTFYEESPGQKAQQMESYYLGYLTQIGKEHDL
jgi:hypothetical protein